MITTNYSRRINAVVRGVVHQLMVGVFEKEVFKMGAPLVIQGNACSVSHDFNLVQQYPQPELLGDAG